MRKRGAPGEKFIPPRRAFNAIANRNRRARQRRATVTSLAHSSHQRHPDGPVHYFNSGCWTEKPCHYLTVEDGVVEVCTFEETIPVEMEAVEAVA